MLNTLICRSQFYTPQNVSLSLREILLSALNGVSVLMLYIPTVHIQTWHQEAKRHLSVCASRKGHGYRQLLRRTGIDLHWGSPYKCS